VADCSCIDPFGRDLSIVDSEFLRDAEMNLFVTIPFVKDCRMRIPHPNKGQARSGLCSMPRRAALARALGLIGVGVGIGLSPGAWAAPPGSANLPARNLVIEWRVNGISQVQQRQQGIRSGQLIVDSRGNIIGRSDIGLNRTETTSQGNSVQQVQVINGGRARLFVGETQSHLVWQWAWVDAGATGLGVIGPSGQGGVSGQAGAGTATSQSTRPGLVAQTAWIDLGQGLFVRPRWPGGRAPVQVELEATSRQPMMGGVTGSRLEPDGQTRRTEVATTLSVPMDEWTVVARSGSRTTQQRSGTLSTRDLDETESERLEIRVTAP
jgi:hypothetical protein